MKSMKTFGNPPYKILLIGGTPGVAGEMDSLVENMEKPSGILYISLTSVSMDEQLQELFKAIQKSCEAPCVLVAYDINAWIAILFASAYPEMISKLILIGCPPLEDKYQIDLDSLRKKSLSSVEVNNYDSLKEVIQKNTPKADTALLDWINICHHTDGYNPCKLSTSEWQANAQVYNDVYQELLQKRSNRELVDAISNLSMPVVAFHGESDPLPVKGVRMPFVERLPHYTHVSLAPCGHTPWIEQEEDVTRRFFYLLNREIKTGIKAPVDIQEKEDGLSEE